VTEAPPVHRLPAALVRLGDALRSEGFDEAAVLERLGTGSTLISPDEASVERRRLGDDRLSDLIRLFLLHEPVDACTLDAEGLVLVERDGDAIRSPVAVQPWRGRSWCTTGTRTRQRRTTSSAPPGSRRRSPT
jgi:hypothetical protein